MFQDQCILVSSIYEHSMASQVHPAKTFLFVVVPRTHFEANRLLFLDLGCMLFHFEIQSVHVSVQRFVFGY